MNPPVLKIQHEDWFTHAMKEEPENGVEEDLLDWYAEGLNLIGMGSIHGEEHWLGDPLMQQRSTPYTAGVRHLGRRRIMPAMRLVATYRDDDTEPTSVEIQHQDWFTPWIKEEPDRMEWKRTR